MKWPPPRQVRQIRGGGPRSPQKSQMQYRAYGLGSRPSGSRFKLVAGASFRFAPRVGGVPD